VNLLKLLQSRLQGPAATPTPKPAVSMPTPPPVPRELERIKSLPRRQPPRTEELQELAAAYKARLGIEGGICQCMSKFHRPCCSSLLPVQAWALHEAQENAGLLGPIGVGHGKTLLDLLSAMVVKCRVAVLFLPPNLKRQLLEVDWHYYGQHWKLPNLVGGKFQYPGRPLLHVVAFSELSGAKNSDILERLQPDLIIIDEAHSLANATAARTKRFGRFLRQHPSTKVLCWSGTLTKRSLLDWAHLSAAALKQGSPAPLDYPTLEAWASALDPSDFPSPAGELTKLCEPGETPQEAFSRRVLLTPGVVSSGDAQACQASLVITERKIQAPPEVQVRLDAVVEMWQRPDGEELIDPLSVARCAREVSCGFWYRWRWPRGEPKEVIEKWLEARKAWNKELRDKLKQSKTWMDSPMLCARAAIRWYDGFAWLDEAGVRHVVAPETPSNIEKHPIWRAETFPKWREVKDSASPVTEGVWFSDFLVDDVVTWLEEKPGLAWYESDAFGVRVMQKARERGVPVVHCGPGDEGAGAVLKLTGKERALLTIRSHGTGKNLQMFHRNLVANPPSGGAEWEQLLGRTHRQGQVADEVTVEVYRHTQPFREAIETARELSAYIQGAFGATQKLVTKATWGF
jgi:hypothetical protein